MYHTPIRISVPSRLYCIDAQAVKSRHNTAQLDEKECINGAEVREMETEREKENKRRETITDERMKLVKLH